MTRRSIRTSLAGPLATLLAAMQSLAGVIVPSDTRPVAVIGGVLALPLEGSPERWPESVTLQRADGGAPIEGSVAWIGTAAASLERSWTTPEQALDVRPIARAPADRPPQASGTLVLLAPMPADLRGALSLDGVSIEPQWITLSQPTPDAGLARLAPPEPDALDRPPLDAPGEWFRWWLIADEARVSPPPPDRGGDRVAGLFALHLGQLWQAGLDRVERTSPGVARELRERLTGTVTETRGQRTVRIAAWMSRAEQLAFTLSTMLDLTRTDEQVMQALLTRLRAEPPVTCWIEADSGSSLRVAIANAGRVPLSVEAAWLESPAMPATPIDVPAAGISRHVVERPSELLPDALTRNAAPLGGTLLLRAGAWQLRMPVGPAQIIPRPPGYGFGVLRPPLSLADAQRLRIAPPPAEWCTTASLRRRGERWELFAECLRPVGSDFDTLEVVVGEAHRGLARIVVHESGDPVVEGLPGLRVPRITRGSFADRWRAVIEIPSEWLEVASSGAAPSSVARGTVLLLGVARTPAGVGTRQTGALAVPAWMPVPVLSLDPSGWWVPQPVGATQRNPGTFGP